MQTKRILLALSLLSVIAAGCTAAPSSSNQPADGAQPAATPVATLQPTEAAASASAPAETSSPFIGVRLVDANGQSVQEWPSPSGVMFQPLWLEHNSEQSLLLYSAGSSLPKLLSQDGTVITWDEPSWDPAPESFSNDYGFDVLYADRLLNDEIYAVKGNRTLYLVNTASGEAEKLYTSALPVYGIAASPDNSKVALLISSEETLAPDADLLVLDRSGNTVFSQPKAGYISHSDGFLFVYPMAWTDNSHVAVPVLGNGAPQYGNGGSRIVSVEGAGEVFRERPSLPADVLMLLSEHAGTIQFPNELNYYQIPGSQPPVYVVEAPRSKVWRFVPDTGQVTEIGHGRLLFVSGEGNALLASVRESEASYILTVGNEVTSPPNQ